VKYTVHYGRKTPTRVAEFDMVEVGLTMEFDDSVTPYETGFKMVKDKVEAWIKEAVGPIEKAKPKPERPATTTIQTVAQAFPQELKGQLYFEDSGDHILVKARKYLGSDTFRQVMDVVKQFGGEYVSAGRESHFRIRKLGV